ncbi:hypothetical protein ACFCXG_27760, partial [Streptomyces sp. NPDC056295]|uniref:hypothetical protein n=1 Tax=Streptomyces sp. NPDC056295 TaxID=3345774 RepID=UPI0035DA25F0
VFEEPGSGFGADGGFEFGLQRVLKSVEMYIYGVVAEREGEGREGGGWGEGEGGARLSGNGAGPFRVRTCV